MRLGADAAFYPNWVTLVNPPVNAQQTPACPQPEKAEFVPEVSTQPNPVGHWLFGEQQ